MRKGLYKDLQSYRQMKRWLRRAGLPKTDILLSIIWENYFDPYGNHRFKGKLPIKQLFPVNNPREFRSWKLSVERMGIINLIGDCDYILGSETKEVFADAIEEIRMWQSMYKRQKELEVRQDSLENRTAKSLVNLLSKIDDMQSRLDVLSGSGLKLIQDDD
jgi:hypothetical protein